MKLVIDQLEKNFNGKKVIKNASFEFEKGKIYGLLGRNGSGKTTLFNCISKDLNYESGTIQLEEAGQFIDYKETDIGLVHATPNVPDFMTGYEFIKFFIDMNQEQMKNIRTPDAYLGKVGCMLLVPSYLEVIDEVLVNEAFLHGQSSEVYWGNRQTAQLDGYWSRGHSTVFIKIFSN